MRFVMVYEILISDTSKIAEPEGSVVEGTFRPLRSDDRERAEAQGGELLQRQDGKK